MHDRTKFALPKNVFDLAPRGKVDLVENELFELVQSGKSRLLKGRIIVIIDIVDADQGGVGYKEGGGEQKHNAPGGPINEAGILRHGSSSLFCFVGGSSLVKTAITRRRRGISYDRAAI